MGVLSLPLPSLWLPNYLHLSLAAKRQRPLPLLLASRRFGREFILHCSPGWRCITAFAAQKKHDGKAQKAFLPSLASLACQSRSIGAGARRRDQPAGQRARQGPDVWAPQQPPDAALTLVHRRQQPIVDGDQRRGESFVFAESSSSPKSPTPSVLDSLPSTLAGTGLKAAGKCHVAPPRRVHATVPHR